MDTRKTAATLTGLPLFQALKKLADNGCAAVGIHYEESSAERLQVIGVEVVDEVNKTVSLIVSGNNPIKFLPSVYHDNDFLKRFLWIPQHIHYDIVSCLDNLHYFFTPLEAPDEFVNWMGSWFSISERLNLSSDKMRIFLQNALRLYRWRGTRIGLENLVKMVMGLEIEIYENTFPVSEYVIDESLVADGVIIDAFEGSQNFFMVHVFAYMDQLSKEEKMAIFELIKQEKPVNSRFFVTYKKRNADSSAGMIITEDTTIQENGDQE